MKKPYVSAYRAPGDGERTALLRAFFNNVRRMIPAVRFCPEKDPFPGDRRIKALRYTGLPCRGHQNTVFAYIGFPENARAGAKVPGMVLVHGGAGHAYAEWVQYWVNNGWAAISFDGFGQIYAGEDGTYEAELDYWKADPTLVLPQDGYMSANAPFEEQGFTYYVADVLLAHTLLREDKRVNKAMVGLTGISWGGIAAGPAMGLDGRFAFCAPVYGCGFADRMKTGWGELFRGKDIETLWDARFFLGNVNVPVRYFNGDADPFFDALAATASAAAAPYGSLTLLPGFTHGQIEGSAIPELMRFANEQAGRGKQNIAIEAVSGTPDKAELRFSLPGDVKQAEVCIYYKTENIAYNGQLLTEGWKRLAYRPDGDTAHLDIPENARLFYFCVEGISDGGQKLHATTGVYTRQTWEDE